MLEPVILGEFELKHYRTTKNMEMYIATEGDPIPNVYVRKEHLPAGDLPKILRIILQVPRDTQE